MQSLLRSMSPEQRAELESMMDALLQDDRLLVDLAQLASNLDLLLPGGLGERVPFGGDEPLGLEGALAQIARLAGDGPAGGRAVGRRVARRPRRDRPRRGPRSARRRGRPRPRRARRPGPSARGGRLPDPRRRAPGADAARQPADRPEGPRRPVRPPPARCVRRPSDRSRRAGEGSARRRPSRTSSATRSTSTCAATLFNALAREENAPAARRAPRRPRRPPAPADFEVYRTEQLTRTSTVLLVDMSRSMLLRGCFLAAKKVAVALDTLIRTQYPRDHLSVIGFAYYAREIRPGAAGRADLARLRVRHEPPARPAARPPDPRASPASNKEIVVITDGEPTAHFEDGQVEFNYPPTRRTISETLREVQRCTKEGITINTFMLERSRALAEFVAHMTRLNRGRAFYATPGAARRVRPGRLRRTAHEAGVVGPILPGSRRGVERERMSMERRRLVPFLLFLHVMGAILAFGPTFAYSIMGSLAAQGAAARELQLPPGRSDRQRAGLSARDLPGHHRAAAHLGRGIRPSRALARHRDRPVRHRC